MKGNLQQLKSVLLNSALALLGSALIVFGAHATEADASELEIHVPTSSDDGAFVVKVNNPRKIGETRTQLELWRSYNGGQFELVSAQPQFHAVSQMLYRQGRYAYQARVVSVQNGQRVQQAVSETSYINVNLRYPELAASSK